MKVNALPMGLFIVLLAAIAGPASGQVAQSTFDSDLNGWTSNTPAEISWSNTGGNPGGFIRFEDVSGAQTYVSAPAQFLGDYSFLNGIGVIQFDHKIISETAILGFFPYEIRLSGPDGAAKWDGPTPTGPNNWVTQTAPINIADWTVTSGTWAGLLANVTSFQIDIELVGNGIGTDIEGIDNVQVAVVPEPDTWVLLAFVTLLATQRRRIRGLVRRAR